MTIPYNAAGQQAFDVFYKVAARLYSAAQEAVDAYIAENCPDSRTTGERHADGRYQRTVRTSEPHDKLRLPNQRNSVKERTADGYGYKKGTDCPKQSVPNRKRTKH